MLNFKTITEHWCLGHYDFTDRLFDFSCIYRSFERWKRWMHLHFLLSFLCSPLSFVLFYAVKINFQFCYGNSSGCLAILFEMVSVLTSSSFITVFPFHEYLLWPIFFWWGLDIFFQEGFSGRVYQCFVLEFLCVWD